MPLPPPSPTTPSSSRIHDPHARVHVLRIRVGGVDHLFFGPAIDIEGEIQEIEVLGITNKESLVQALSNKPLDSEMQ